MGRRPLASARKAKLRPSDSAPAEGENPAFCPHPITAPAAPFGLIRRVDVRPTRHRRYERQELVGVMRQLILCHRKVDYWPQSGAATSVNSASDD